MSNGYYLQGVLHNKKEKDYSKEVVANETHGHPIEHMYVFIADQMCFCLEKKFPGRIWNYQPGLLTGGQQNYLQIQNTRHTGPLAIFVVL